MDDKTLKKIDDEELCGRWWQAYISAASQIKRELDRRQNAPRLRVVKSRYSKPDPNTKQLG